MEYRDFYNQKFGNKIIQLPNISFLCSTNEQPELKKVNYVQIKRKKKRKRENISSLR